jgi:hypothetical protein
VTVVPAKLTLSWLANELGVLVINNQQTSEINLGGLTLLASGTPKFTFPVDTILSAGASLSLDQDLTKLNNNEEIILISPVGRVLATLPPAVNKAELLAAVNKLNLDLAVAQKLLAFSPAKNLEALNKEPLSQATLATSTFKLTAKTSESWWQRWLKLIRVP